MGKIFNVRLPNAARQDYDPSQFDQLVRSLEQIVLQLNSTYGSTYDQNQAAAASWFGTSPGAGGFAGRIQGFQYGTGISLPYAMLMSNVDQTSAGITSENLLEYELNVLNNGIYVLNDTDIYVPCAGQYLVTFSIQFANRGNDEQIIEVWAKAGGNNYPLSNTRFDIPARKSLSVYSHITAAVSGIFTVENPTTDYLQIAWWSDGADVVAEHYAAGTSPTRPEIPSVILTINFVSAI